MTLNIFDTAHAMTAPVSKESLPAEHTAPAGEHSAVTTHGTAPAETGLLASLGINPSLFAFQLINFLIVIGIVWFVILKPLTTKMTDRQKMIDDSLDQAEKIKDRLVKSDQEYQVKMDQAKVEANKILEKATSEADATAAALKVKAKKDIEALIDQAKRNLQIERDDMMAGIKKEAADLVVMALEKILIEKNTSTEDKRNIETMLKQISYESK